MQDPESRIIRNPLTLHPNCEAHGLNEWMAITKLAKVRVEPCKPLVTDHAKVYLLQRLNTTGVTVLQNS